MVDARELLAEARAIYDRDEDLLRIPLGARWMRHALEIERGPFAGGATPARVARLVALKYALCTAAALVPIGLALASGHAWWALGAPAAFYLVECPLVFVVPAALIGAERPFRASRERVRAAGGVTRALPAVLLIALEMVTGSLFGRGVRRSWCVGCLAVVVWFARGSPAPSR